MSSTLAAVMEVKFIELSEDDALCVEVHWEFPCDHKEGAWELILRILMQFWATLEALTAQLRYALLKAALRSVDDGVRALLLLGLHL